MDKETYMKDVEIVHGNILDPECVRRAVENIDVIYHLAAIVDYGPAPKTIMYNVNVEGTRNMLSHSKAKKFIYLSTTSVYGKRMKENPARESTPYNPYSFYGRTKILAEKMVLDKGGIILRSPVIYGEGFNEGFGVVLSQLEKGRMPIIGSGGNLIQWIHISDLVQALLLAKDRGKAGEIYLVAGKEAKTQRELFSILARCLGAKEPDRKISKLLALSMAHYSTVSARIKGKKPKLLPEHISRIAGDRTFDISKSERELGFHPQIGYEIGAKEIVDEYLRNKELGLK
jgi:nucleoside-diphosphate-sugar epimerase